ncbi:Protein of unknown function (DUF2911) [Neolewinella xylanilytica]|uniref:DUF2911 family protein n=1 Tax=Neolewinella xylanilytica TaxID=1514080 RepID=A0A2S6I6H1_9BACT|nr:DUF2911 domain-containing protein [Neolewinella xylanilytica]PPK87084.1 Protein of unknown function (DUF2911) [Neolewinella xylanilytica]
MYTLPRFTGLCLVALLTLFSTGLSAQGGEVRASPTASTSQTLGADTEITFDYSRPAVKGRTVWGDMVPYGMAEGNQYSDNKPYPWRAGANENTTVTFSEDVMVEGEPLAAGTYSIHMIPAESGAWTVIFNKAANGWGSYKYDEAQDALRVEVSPEEAPMQEWLTFGFDDNTATSTKAYLHWEKLKVPFAISVAE